MNEASVKLQKLGYSKLVLPSMHGFKVKLPATGGFLITTAVSQMEVDTIVQRMRDVYATFTYPMDSQYYAGKKVHLEVKSITPTTMEAVTYRVLDKMCRDRFM